MRDLKFISQLSMCCEVKGISKILLLFKVCNLWYYSKQLEVCPFCSEETIRVNDEKIECLPSIV